MTFEIINKYLQENNRPFRFWFVKKEPYTAFDRVLIGNRVNSGTEGKLK